MAVAPFEVRVQSAPFDAAAEAAQLAQACGGADEDLGALVTFTGLCRADRDSAGRALAGLVLEHYPGMAEAEMTRHLETARTRWPLLGARIIHRFGRIVPGEPIVLVIAASAHRDAAFDAARFLMDWLKTSAPFWKKEEREGAGDWVAAKASDDDAAARWGKD